MKRFVMTIAIAMLAGCGVETTTTAATGAAIKKQELEEGLKTQERVKQKIEQTLEQAQQRAQRAEDADAK